MITQQMQQKSREPVEQASGVGGIPCPTRCGNREMAAAARSVCGILGALHPSLDRRLFFGGDDDPFTAEKMMAWEHSPDRKVILQWSNNLINQRVTERQQHMVYHS